MKKTIKKFLPSVSLLAIAVPAICGAQTTGLPSAQTATSTKQSTTAASASSTRKVDINWSNLMLSPIAGGKKGTAVGVGFGDTWNKYAWSMKDINGGMLVGTKNAFYDAQQYFSPSGGVQTCMDNNIYQVTGIHKPLACMELFGSPAAVTAQMATSVSANTRFAEIWRYDYVLKNWTKVREDAVSQGFRVMERHNGKVYVGSDLGAFITGVDLNSGAPGAWNFPGSQLLSSVDGKTFNQVESCSAGPCNSVQGLSNPYGLLGTYPNYTGAVNTSIRALASFKGKLYVGTFNATGGQLWAYDDVNATWSFIPIQGVTGNPYKPAIMELRVYKDKLYIGVGGPAEGGYLYSYDGVSASAGLVAGQPPLPSSNLGVIKLFTGSNGLLYIGNTDLTIGFSLMTYDGANFNTVTMDGLGYANNAYSWSMAELNGRIYLGTFNQDFSSDPTTASAQLWYLDTLGTWQRAALPKNFGLLNYGIRNLEVGNGQIFLGTASNMLAPDLISGLLDVRPGTEVWSLR